SGQYGSFGEVSHQTAESWALRQGKPTINQPLRYAGQYADSETGLHYNLFRYYDPGVGRFTTQDPIGLNGGLNLYQYAPNPLGWVDPLGLSGENIFIHYTDKAGFDSIMKSGVLEPNAKGKVYITDILMSPDDVMRDLLINNPRYAGRGDYSIIFKTDEAQRANINLSSRLEYIHSGRLKLNDVLYSGKNPYSSLSSLDYETRLKLTDNQVKVRGC
ncbi:type IV secretion protein Rhs, partial [Enterobacteriaceae bacterium BIT-l23]|nr:type IV secretion protein Rhs [Enterobacteriaceae bacterium BIT-l23]